MRMKSIQRQFWVQLCAALYSIVILSTAYAQQPAVATVGSSTLTAEEVALAARIKVETIKEVTAALSAEEMQGRGTMQPGGDKAASYIASRFAQLQLKPLGNKDSYL